MSEELISRVKKFAIEHCEMDDIHGFPHVERVHDFCILLGKHLNANLKILDIASFLHDTGRIKEREFNGDKNHAELSAEMSRQFLSNFSEDISNAELEEIIHCIRSHSFSNGVMPESLEAKILSDADKIDAMGAIGLYRTIGFTIKNGGNLDDVIKHLQEKILKLPEHLLLERSKQLASERQELVLRFYNQIMAQKNQ